MIVNDLLNDVSYNLVEVIVDTMLVAPVTAGVGVTVTPVSMSGIYPDALLIFGVGPNIEIITVTSVTPTTFVATLAFNHAAGEPIFASTFPSGQPGFPLWTQTEVLGYLANVQNDFLLKVRPLYKTGTLTIVANTNQYTAPADAIRIEHVSIQGGQLYNTSVADQDMAVIGWMVNQASIPQAYYQDLEASNAITVPLVGFTPMPTVGNTAELWYSYRASTTLGLLDSLTVGDIFTPALKWGVLQQCYSKDGEQRDPVRADFAKKMFEFWVFLAIRYMNGQAAFIEEAEAEESFKPLVVAFSGN